MPAKSVSANVEGAIRGSETTHPADRAQTACPMQTRRKNHEPIDRHGWFTSATTDEKAFRSLLSRETCGHEHHIATRCRRLDDRHRYHDDFSRGVWSRSGLRRPDADVCLRKCRFRGRLQPVGPWAPILAAVVRGAAIRVWAMLAAMPASSLSAFAMPWLGDAGVRLGMAWHLAVRLQRDCFPVRLPGLLGDVLLRQSDPLARTRPLAPRRDSLPACGRGSKVGTAPGDDRSGATAPHEQHRRPSAGAQRHRGG